MGEQDIVENERKHAADETPVIIARDVVNKEKPVAQEKISVAGAGPSLEAKHDAPQIHADVRSSDGIGKNDGMVADTIH